MPDSFASVWLFWCPKWQIGPTRFADGVSCKHLTNYVGQGQSRAEIFWRIGQEVDPDKHVMIVDGKWFIDLDAVPSLHAPSVQKANVLHTRHWIG